MPEAGRKFSSLPGALPLFTARGGSESTKQFVMWEAPRKLKAIQARLFSPPPLLFRKGLCKVLSNTELFVGPKRRASHQHNMRGERVLLSICRVHFALLGFPSTKALTYLSVFYPAFPTLETLPKGSLLHNPEMIWRTKEFVSSQGTSHLTFPRGAEMLFL